MYQVNFQITDNCNIRCNHCAYSCGPNGFTMDDRSIEKVIDNISPKTTDLLFTGGEPLSVKSSLKHALSYLKERKASVLPKGKVYVETNGFWVRDQESAYRTLKELYDLGVNTVALASLDKFHREQGLDIDKLEFKSDSPLYQAMEQLANEMGMVRRYPIAAERKGATHGVIPFGRAKQLPLSEHKDRTHCGVSWDFRDENREVTIAPDGRVYLCCWKIAPSIGSAINTPIEELVKNAKENPIMRALMDEGLKEAAKKMGVFKHEESYMYDNNPCVKCEEIFKKSSED